MTTPTPADPHPPGTIRVACVQMEPVIGERERNIARSVEFAETAAAAGANLVVLPELTSSGYVFRSRSEAHALAEAVPGGPASTAWAAFCAEQDAYLVAGVAELDGGRLYNSSAVFGPGGHIGTFRKVHLWDEENLYFEPGDRGFPVFHTPIGRIATFICYDCWFPESFRGCSVRGAEIICVPTNWVPIPGQPPGQAMANILVMAGAHTNSVFVAAADRVGTERGVEFLGRSLIAGYTGWPIAGPASPDREEIIYADIDLREARSGRQWNAFNDPIRDRRPDVYAKFLGGT